MNSKDYKPKTCCSVRICDITVASSRKSAEKINFHRFPKNKKQLDLWIKFCDRSEDWVPLENNIICSKHFTRDSYSLAYSIDGLKVSKARLTDEAVPTIFDINEVKDSKVLEQERKQIIQELLESYESEQEKQINDSEFNMFIQEESCDSYNSEVAEEEILSDKDYKIEECQEEDFEETYAYVVPAKDRIYSFSQFLNEIPFKKEMLKNWNVISQSNGVCFYKLTVDQFFTDVKFLAKIIIEKSLKLTVYFRDYQINSQEVGVAKLESWTSLEEIFKRFERTWQIETNERFHLQKALVHLIKIENGEFFNKFQKQIQKAKAELNSVVIHPDYKNVGGSEDITIYEQVPIEQSLDNQVEFKMEEEIEILENQENEEADYIVDESDLLENIEMQKKSTNDQGFCENCGEEFLLKDQEVLHNCSLPSMKKDLNRQAFQCDICGKSYHEYKKLKSHLKDHRFRKSVPCPQCNKMLNNSVLKRHIEQVHNKVLHPCSKCGKTFLRNYIKNSHEEKCDGILYDKYLLNRTKSEPTYYSCTIDSCSEKYLNKISLQRHCKKVHGIELKMDKYCFECGEEFESQSLYFVHCRKHYKFSCSVCSKRFKSKEAFDKHSNNSHEPNEKRPFKCDECEGSYKTVVHLQSHKKLQHSNKRDFCCEICDRRFPDITRLNTHIRIVHDKTVFPHKCLYCKVKYADVNSLRNHVQTKHQTDLIFECSECKKRFKYFGDLRTHRNHAHGLSSSNRKLNLLSSIEIDDVEYYDNENDQQIVYIEEIDTV